MSWKDTLAKVAPTIAGALGGPFASVAVKTGLGALGIDDGDEAELEKIIMSGNPDALLALKKADQDYRVTLKRLDVEDRDSARKLAIAKGMLPQLVLSVVYTVAYGVVLYCFMTGKIQVPENQQILFGSLIGILTGAQVQILNFWFGSSSGSKEKDHK